MKNLSRQDILEVLEKDWGTYIQRFQSLSPAARTAFLERQGYARLADLLAHLIAWWKVGREAIERYRSDPGAEAPRHDVDAFNAQAVAAARDQGEGEVIASFEGQRRSLVEFVVGLPSAAFENEKVSRQFQMEFVGHLAEHRVPVSGYSGKRDVRFVTIRRGGLLEDSHHRLLAAWAADCADHALAYFQRQHPDDERPRRAIAAASAWARGEVTMMQAREAAYAAHAAARATSGAAREAARAAGHAAATAHMADHELGAAVYAIRAARAAVDPAVRAEAGRLENAWQRQQLPEAIRALVISDERLRNQELWSLFED